MNIAADLDQASAEKAIRAPLEVYNRLPGVAEPVQIQDELVEAVLDQVPAYDAGGAVIRGGAAAISGVGRIATPLLQPVMETVWERERAEGSRELRMSTLQNLEGVEKIVDTHLANALRTLGEGERQTAIDMFDHLVTPSGGKIAESVPDLAKRTGRSEEQIGRVLGKLDHARIVRPVPAPPGQDPMRFRRYEIFHDVLTPTINHTIAAYEEQRRERQLQLARRARWLTRMLALAGAVIVAAGVGIGLLLSRGTPEQVYTFALHSGTGLSASASGTIRHADSGWSVQLTAVHLPQPGPGQFYQCWWGLGNRPRLVSAGTFTVGPSGTATVQMWTAADPEDFPAIEITLDSAALPGQQGRVILSGTVYGN